MFKLLQDDRHSCEKYLKIHLPNAGDADVISHLEEKRIVDTFDAQFTERCPEEHLRDLMARYFYKNEEKWAPSVELEYLKLRVVTIMNKFFSYIRKSAETTVVEVCPGSDCKVIIRTIPQSILNFKKWGVGHLKTRESPMTWWLDHAKAREYDKIVFTPAGNHNPKNLNLFNGLAIPPSRAIRGDVSAVIDHILNIWCKGDQEACDYILNWMAHTVQRLGVKIGVIVTIKGMQGSGKGCIIQLLATIFGAASFHHVQDLEHILGNFNSDQELTNLLAFIDEAIFAGNKQQAQKLKTLVTETTRKFEAKYLQAITIENHSNYIAASNFDSGVSKESDDRRNMCVETSNKWAGIKTLESKAYFDKVNATDPRCFAYFLYNRDISQFIPSMYPSTPYGRYQKQLGMKPEHAFIDHWIKHDLYSADIACDCGKCLPDHREYRKNYGPCNLQPGAPNSLSIGVDALYDLFSAYHKRYNEKAHKCAPNAFYKMFADIFPAGSEYELVHTHPVNTDGPRNPNGSFPKIHKYVFESIDFCKNAMMQHLREPKWYTDSL